MIQERYRMNCSAISSEEMQVLKRARVCVVGCGGLGGHVIELLARLGIGHLVAVDGDVFSQSNLNRQLLCLESNLGKSKAEEAAIRVNQVNSEIKVDAHCLYMDEENAPRLLSGCDLAVDALDNVESRLMLEDACAQEGIPLVHGAIGGWYGQVALVMPGSDLLRKIYGRDTDKGEESTLGNPSFIPAHIASIQVAECVKALLGRETPLSSGVLQIDLLDGNFDIIQF
ncbi:MAG: HesA/MoeB/ThiF family protein [Anaerovoracaceae bacterium]|jgi:molybdopterin/thiamine biosynthesis adenylyltransferase